MGLFSFNNNQQLSVIQSAIEKLNKGDYTSIQNMDDNETNTTYKEVILSIEILRRELAETKTILEEFSKGNFKIPNTISKNSWTNSLDILAEKMIQEQKNILKQQREMETKMVVHDCRRRSSSKLGISPH